MPKSALTFSIVKSCTIPEVALVLTRGCNFQGPTQIYKSVLNLQFDGNRPRSGHSVCKQGKGGGGGGGCWGNCPLKFEERKCQGEV